MMDLHYWNKKLYGEPPAEHNAEWFAQFGIESAPLFPDKCWSHIPICWADDVSEMIVSLQRLQPSIQFIQIKEKYGTLRVSVEPMNEEVIDIVGKCVQSLTEKGVHHR